MEIRYFTEVYDDEGSVFESGDCILMNEAANMENCEIFTPERLLDTMADFVDDNGFRAFMDSVKRADKIICFFNDAVYPGQIACIHEIIIK